MSERQSLTKYYPADFDPAGLEIMAPFSMRCDCCGEYIDKGHKLDALRETTGEKEYGAHVYRFHIRCPGCSAEITFRTDPEHLDYKCEHGATRNFEP